MTQYISLEQVKKAAREAYDNGTLGALNFSECMNIYPDSNSRCAVAACFNDETIKKIKLAQQETASFTSLINNETLSCLTAEKSKIHDIQHAHDKWATTIDTNKKQDARKKFLKLIDYKTPVLVP
tara:strand:- start:3665 stop:4039 length:375 start_codon:yes stop_codon:yes gene_type:complete